MGPALRHSVNEQCQKTTTLSTQASWPGPRWPDRAPSDRTGRSRFPKRHTPTRFQGAFATESDLLALDLSACVVCELEPVQISSLLHSESSETNDFVWMLSRS